MGCGASKPADAPPGAAPLKAAAAAYKAGSPRAEPSSAAKVAKRLDVRPPAKPAAPTAAAKAQELTRSGTAGISDANRLQISAAGRRKTATRRRIAVSAEKNQDGAELSTYLPPVVEKDEADQAKGCLCGAAKLTAEDESTKGGWVRLGHEYQRRYHAHIYHPTRTTTATLTSTPPRASPHPASLQRSRSLPDRAFG